MSEETIAAVGEEAQPLTPAQIAENRRTWRPTEGGTYVINPKTGLGELVPESRTGPGIPKSTLAEQKAAVDNANAAAAAFQREAAALKNGGGSGRRRAVGAPVETEE